MIATINDTQKRFKFSKNQQLHSKKDYDAVFLANQSVAGDCFRLIVRQNTLGYGRLGLRVGKKNIKRAVHRNLIKRLIRENFRYHQYDLKNWDIVVIVRRKLSQRNRKAIHQTLEKLWRRI